jgi:4-hydroxybenzoyl-CoA thioesterase
MVTAQYTVKLEWGDCDPARIAYYPNYFDWFDRATRNLFDMVGLPWEVMHDAYNIIGMPIVEANARFVAPARFGETLMIESSVAEWKRRSLRVAHIVTNAGRLTAEGYEVRAWTMEDPDEPGKLRAAEIPAEIRARFADDGER